MYWKNKLENERKIHEESLRESVTTFSDLEEKMREYEEISVEIKQISAEISARNSLTVSAAESIKSEVSKEQKKLFCYNLITQVSRLGEDIEMMKTNLEMMEKDEEEFLCQSAGLIIQTMF